MDAVQTLLHDAAAVGLHLYVKDGLLRGHPSGVATPELRARIDALRADLVAHFTSPPPPPARAVTTASGPPKPVGPPLRMPFPGRDRGSAQPSMGPPKPTGRALESGTPFSDERARNTAASARVESRPNPTDLGVFAAWDEHLGYAPVTLADLIRQAEQSAGLRAALGKAAGDAAALHALILSLADLTVGGHRIVPVGTEDAVVPNDGERRWRLASMWSIDLAAKKVKSAELFDNREVDL